MISDGEFFVMDFLPLWDSLGTEVVLTEMML